MVEVLQNLFDRGHSVRRTGTGVLQAALIIFGVIFSLRSCINILAQLKVATEGNAFKKAWRSSNPSVFFATRKRNDTLLNSKGTALAPMNERYLRAESYKSYQRSFWGHAAIPDCLKMKFLNISKTSWGMGLQSKWWDHPVSAKHKSSDFVLMQHDATLCDIQATDGQFQAIQFENQLQKFWLQQSIWNARLLRMSLYLSNYWFPWEQSQLRLSLLNRFPLVAIWSIVDLWYKERTRGMGFTGNKEPYWWLVILSVNLSLSLPINENKEQHSAALS